MRTSFHRRVDYPLHNHTETLEYYLLEEDISGKELLADQYPGSTHPSTVYGVKVLQLGPDGALLALASQREVTTSRGRMEEILDQLVSSLVPPCTLDEIVSVLVYSV